MSKEYKKIVTDVSEYMNELGKASPEVMQSFMGMHNAANKSGVLNEKTKELIALAIGISQRCDGCIGFHTKALLKLGTTREEFVEMLNVAIYMGGGPVVMYAADALRAYDQFSE